MVKVIDEKSKKKDAKIAIVVARFNEFITQRLLDGCLDELKKCGVSSDHITVVWVPGSFEIPVVAQKFAKKKAIDAVICLGAVIKGETKHYDLVCEGATYGIAQASINTGKPVIFGVLATETIDQANKRSQEKGDNKGRDAALTALEMINVVSKIK